MDGSDRTDQGGEVVDDRLLLAAVVLGTGTATGIAPGSVDGALMRHVLATSATTAPGTMPAERQRSRSSVRARSAIIRYRRISASVTSSA